ncbi:MAG: polysaccharide biosynthesis protein [Clostridiales bacterium]|nr:polysaccharide biosynthesis protein [Clostridiales bacterium]MDY3746081.1 polysaccharide biosynthesis protein [Lachnospiraceae bacterium]
MGKKKENSFLMQGTILAAAAIITKIIGLAYRIPLTNILGEEGNGYYGVVFQVYNLALMLTSYSMPMAVSKLVSERLAKRQYKNAQRVFRSAMTIAVIAGGAATLIVFFGAGFIGSKILKMELSVYALRTLSPCILIVAFLGVFRGYFQGHRTMIPTAVSQILEQIVNAVFSIIGAYFLFKIGLGMAEGAKSESYGAALSAAGGTIGTVAGALTALVFLVLLYTAYTKIVRQRVRRDRTRRVESNKKIYKVLLLTLAPVILSSTLSNITNILDQGLFTNVMASLGYTEKEYTSLLGLLNGQYDTMVGIPFSISTALASSFMPSLVAAIQVGTRREIHQKIDLITRFNMMIIIPCAAGFIALARPIMDLLFFTQNNEIPAMLLRIGAFSVILLCLSSVTNAALQGMDKMMQPVKNAAIALAVHTVALIIMLAVFKWNVYGVVVSKIVFAGVICLLNSRDLKRACGYVQEKKKTFLIPAIAAVIMGAAAMLVYKVFALFCPGAVATIIAILAAVIVYCVSLVMLGGVSEQELLEMPKGTMIIKLLKKVHLLR